MTQNRNDTGGGQNVTLGLAPKEGGQLIVLYTVSPLGLGIMGGFFLTTPDFGHQIDIAFKIVPHALFVNLHNPIQRSVISRPFVDSRLV